MLFPIRQILLTKKVKLDLTFEENEHQGVECFLCEFEGDCSPQKEAQE